MPPVPTACEMRNRRQRAVALSDRRQQDLDSNGCWGIRISSVVGLVLEAGMVKQGFNRGSSVGSDGAVSGTFDWCNTNMAGEKESR